MTASLTSFSLRRSGAVSSSCVDAGRHARSTQATNLVHAILD